MLINYIKGRHVDLQPSSAARKISAMGQVKHAATIATTRFRQARRHVQNCGSREPFGPPILHQNRPPIFNVEARNDRNMIVFAGVLGGLGAAYGFATSAGPISAPGQLLRHPWRLGRCPLATLVNITRRLWR